MTVTNQLEKKTASIDGLDMAFIEEGQGRPIVFLHGNPTSSYLWRNIIPHLSDLGRCIVPDLIGMGDSAKLKESGSDSYRFVEHRDYLDKLLASLGVQDDVVLVLHDWGSALGFDWVRRHPNNVAGVAYMESIVKPLTWEEFPEIATDMFKAMRSENGEHMVLSQNMFVEKLLAFSVGRGLTEEEMAEYRRPFLEPGESRRPTLTWPREVPIEGSPGDVHEIVEAYSEFFAMTTIPKLFVNAEPGLMLTGSQREFCRSWPNQTEVTVPGLHYIQEDSPDEIGHAVREFINAIG